MTDILSAAASGITSGFLDNVNINTRSIAILDRNGNQMFETISIIDLAVAKSKTFPRHTLENGTQISDHSIVEDDRINISVILDPVDYTDVYEQIKQAFDDDELFTVQTRVEIHSNMVIQGLPRTEDSSIADTVAISFEMEQQRFSETEFGPLPESKVSNASDSDTKQIGQKQGEEGSFLGVNFGGFFGG